MLFYAWGGRIIFPIGLLVLSGDNTLQKQNYI